jgi:hypothetical protein
MHIDLLNQTNLGGMWFTWQCEHLESLQQDSLMQPQYGNVSLYRTNNTLKNRLFQIGFTQYLLLQCRESSVDTSGLMQPIWHILPLQSMCS